MKNANAKSEAVKKKEYITYRTGWMEHEYLELKEEWYIVLRNCLHNNMKKKLVLKWLYYGKDSPSSIMKL